MTKWQTLSVKQCRVDVKTRLADGHLSVQVLVSEFGHFASSGRALDEAFHDKVGLVHVFDSAGILAHSRGDGVQAHGSALELVDDGCQQFVVHLVESEGVDIQGLEGILGYLQIDGTVAFDLRKVAHTAQQGVGDTRRTAAAAGDLVSGMAVDGYVQQAGTAADNLAEGVCIVVLQVALDAKSRQKRRCEQAASGSGAYQREVIEVNLDSTRRRTLSIIMSMR